MPKDAYTRQQHRSTSHRDHSQQARQGLASLGVELISSDDYFLKSDNFRLWLKQYKGKVCLLLHFVQRLSRVAGCGHPIDFCFFLVLTFPPFSAWLLNRPVLRCLNPSCWRHTYADRTNTRFC